MCQGEDHLKGQEAVQLQVLGLISLHSNWPMVEPKIIEEMAARFHV